ncbi:PadR family transcriptional regulator [Cellulomonas sp. CW35]|uniref:PadR family transcriptional regulator n=1 Tax=Cellulomonas uda TaxID=1714 RepID=A0A4Y3KA76_CELUD|nr:MULTISPECIES: PadR family transcriptional regulator [Cellulomonas]ASR56505.1 PadR family transcriptional regulator [Cellulomonas sp. PSBB021]NII67541.1 PadR family transcriptional regulator PadR [Cellulomonas uda]UJP41100.1 PadR family transcriptional regulator [Cellulomonas palmilytica]GEA81379.1 PadR family transcriptional regulator [Cellulomonas uda]
MAAESDALLTQLRKGVLEYCVLACLRKDRAYGLELATRLSRYQVLFASEGTLYPLLSRMRRQGWVETSWQESTSGPPRRYYELTPQGRTALDLFTRAWEPFRQDVDTVLEESR